MKSGFCPASELAKALKIAAQVVERRDTLPILKHVLIDARDGEFTITAGDDGVQFTQRLDAEIAEPFTCTAPAEKLSQIASAVPQDKAITLKLRENARLGVSAGRGHWQLPCLKPDDFPLMPPPETGFSVRVMAQAWAELIERVRGFAGEVPGKTHFSGPLWHVRDGIASLAATQGHCLVSAPYRDLAWPEDAPEIAIGPKALRVMASMGAQASADEEAKFAWSESLTHYQQGGAELIGKTLVGTWPDYSKFLPQDVASPLRFDPAHLLAAIKRVQIIAPSKDPALELTPTDGKLVIATFAKDGASEANEAVSAECSKTFPTAINPNYLTQMMAAIGGDTIEVHQSGPNENALFRRVPSDGAVGMIQPLKTLVKPEAETEEAQ